jgi:hypothetical protein
VAIRSETRKRLWARSGNRCAICRELLVRADGDLTAGALVGQEAHIVARSPGGPRYEDLTLDERDGYSNLILLCANDHTAVDGDAEQFTVNYLLDLKQQHEAWVNQRLEADLEDSRDRPIEKPMNLCRAGHQIPTPATDAPYHPRHHEMINLREQATTQGVCYVSGPSGAGKTRLVTEYCRATASDRGFTLWLDGRSTTTLEASVLRALSDLGLPADRPLDRLQGLMRTTPTPGLVVVDDVGRGVRSAIRRLMPETGAHTLLITTRLSVPGAVNVGPMDITEGSLVDWVASTYGLADAQSAALLRYSGGLPIAIIASGALVATGQIELTDLGSPDAPDAPAAPDTRQAVRLAKRAIRRNLLLGRERSPVAASFYARLAVTAPTDIPLSFLRQVDGSLTDDDLTYLLVAIGGRLDGDSAFTHDFVQQVIERTFPDEVRRAAGALRAFGFDDVDFPAMRLLPHLLRNPWAPSLITLAWRMPREGVTGVPVWLSRQAVRLVDHQSEDTLTTAYVLTKHAVIAWIDSLHRGGAGGVGTHDALVALQHLRRMDDDSGRALEAECLHVIAHNRLLDSSSFEQSREQVYLFSEAYRLHREAHDDEYCYELREFAHDVVETTALTLKEWVTSHVNEDDLTTRTDHAATLKSDLERHVAYMSSAHQFEELEEAAAGRELIDSLAAWLADPGVQVGHGAYEQLVAIITAVILARRQRDASFRQLNGDRPAATEGIHQGEALTRISRAVDLLNHTGDPDEPFLRAVTDDVEQITLALHSATTDAPVWERYLLVRRAAHYLHLVHHAAGSPGFLAGEGSPLAPELLDSLAALSARLASVALSFIEPSPDDESFARSSRYLHAIRMLAGLRSKSLSAVCDSLEGLALLAEHVDHLVEIETYLLLAGKAWWPQLDLLGAGTRSVWSSLCRLDGRTPTVNVATALDILETVRALQRQPDEPSAEVSPLPTVRELADTTRALHSPWQLRLAPELFHGVGHHAEYPAQVRVTARRCMVALLSRPGTNAEELAEAQVCLANAYDQMARSQEARALKAAAVSLLTLTRSPLNPTVSKIAAELAAMEDQAD